MNNISDILFRYIKARYKEKTTLIIGALLIVSYFVDSKFGIDLPDILQILLGAGFIGVPTSSEILTKE